MYILGQVEGRQPWPRFGSLRPTLSFGHIGQSVKEAWFRQNNILECSGFLSLKLEMNRWAEFKWKRAVVLIVIRSPRECEPSWEVLEASGVSTEYWNCLPGRAAEEKPWWGGVPEDCLTPAALTRSWLVTGSPVSSCFLSDQGLRCRWPWASESTWSPQLWHRTVSLCDAHTVRCLHRSELEICLSLQATLWRRQPFNHLCLKNKPLSGAHHTCFHATHVCSDLATSIWE